MTDTPTLAPAPVRQTHMPDPEPNYTERDLAFRVFGGHLVMWRASVNDATGAIEEETYHTAVRNTDDKPTRMQWVEWELHNTLRDAIDQAMYLHGGCTEPDISEVWKTESQMLREGVTEWTK